MQTHLNKIHISGSFSSRRVGEGDERENGEEVEKYKNN
jgi:hypothetical protein